MKRSAADLATTMSSLCFVKVVASSDEVERGEELLEESTEGQRLRWIEIKILAGFVQTCNTFKVP